MDTQIKVIREFYTYNDEFRYTDEISINPDKEVQFSFKEEDNLYLKFIFDESLYSVEYEDYETGNSKKYDQMILFIFRQVEKIWVLISQDIFS